MFDNPRASKRILTALLLATSITTESPADEIVPGAKASIPLPLGAGHTLRLAPIGTDGGLITAWIDADTVRSLYIAPDLQAASEAKALSRPLDRPADLQLCARDDGSYAAAWTYNPVRTRPAPHDYTNLADVRVINVDASGATTSSWRANARRAGSQSVAHVRCLDDGSVSTLWWDVCTGVRTFVGFPPQAFVPEQCADTTGHTLRRRSFQADGTAITHAHRSFFLGTYSNDRFLPLPSGGTLAFVDGLLAVLDAEGRNRAWYQAPQENIGDLYVDGDCGAGDEACVLVNRSYLDPSHHFAARVFDPHLRTISERMLLGTWRYCSMGFGSCSVQVRDGTIACDPQGQCLAIWVELRLVVGDHDAKSRFLGLFGRSLNARTGETGSRTKLMEIDPGHRKPVVMSTGEGRFVVAVPYASRLDLEGIGLVADLPSTERELQSARHLR